MKKCVLGLLIVLLVAAVPASADNKGLFVGGGLGEATQECERVIDAVRCRVLTPGHDAVPGEHGSSGRSHDELRGAGQ